MSARKDKMINRGEPLNEEIEELTKAVQNVFSEIEIDFEWELFNSLVAQREFMDIASLLQAVNGQNLYMSIGNILKFLSKGNKGSVELRKVAEKKQIMGEQIGSLVAQYIWFNTLQEKKDRSEVVDK